MRPLARAPISPTVLFLSLLAPVFAAAHETSFEHAHPHAEGHVSWVGVGIAAIGLVILVDAWVGLRGPRT